MNFRRILPLEDDVLRTNLSASAVLKRVSENMEPELGGLDQIFKKTYSRPYTGEASGMGFKMTRNLSYRNSFNPVITGQIGAMPGHTIVEIKMRLHPGVTAFMIFCLGFLGVAIGVTLVGRMTAPSHVLKDGSSPAVWIPFAMLIAIWLLCTLAFKAESSKSKVFLAQLLKGMEAS